MAISSESAVEAKPGPREKEREPQATRREAPRAGPVEETEQLVFTVRKTTGEVIRIEKIDATGKRAEIPNEEAATLAGRQNLDEIEAALDEAFEAGIFSILDPGSDDEAPEDSAEEIDLRRVLLKLIIGREVRQRLRSRIAQRLVLSQTLSH